jgi:putative transposase
LQNPCSDGGFERPRARTPGTPADNAFIDSLNGKFRAECLNTNRFMGLDEANRKCEASRRDYNEVRPHSAIGNKVQIELHRTMA